MFECDRTMTWINSKKCRTRPSGAVFSSILDHDGTIGNVAVALAGDGNAGLGMVFDPSPRAGEALPVEAHDRVGARGGGREQEKGDEQAMRHEPENTRPRGFAPSGPLEYVAAR